MMKKIMDRKQEESPVIVNDIHVFLRNVLKLVLQ